MEPTRAGVEAFLQSFLAAEEQASRVQKLIRELGHDSFLKRQQAMRELRGLPTPPIQPLTLATRSADAEVRGRARRLLMVLSAEKFDAKIAAALSFIDQRELKGFAPLLLELLPKLHDEYLVRCAERALHRTASAEDADLLRNEIAHGKSPEREAAVVALAAALGPDGTAEILPILEHVDPGMRLAAGAALAELGERKCLPVLLGFLEAEDVSKRRESAAILRALTGERFSYSAVADEKTRKHAVHAWRNWHREHGATARLTFPLPRRRLEVGRTVVCVWARKLFKEVSLEKQDIFVVHGFKYVWGCHATADGRRLVVDAVHKVVIEYDGSGQETWRHTDLPGRPTDVQGLDNGNVLVACSDSNEVVEIGRDGRILWRFEIEGRPTTAQRLENGNTVINLQTAGKVVEVDQQGNQRILVEGLDRAHTAQRLDNGNVLVTEMRKNRVDEYDFNGSLIWSKTGLKNPAQSQRLENGNTLIGDEEGLHEFNPVGQRVWHLPVTRSRFFRY